MCASDPLSDFFIRVGAGTSLQERPHGDESRDVRPYPSR